MWNHMNTLDEKKIFPLTSAADYAIDSYSDDPTSWERFP